MKAHIQTVNIHVHMHASPSAFGAELVKAALRTPDDARLDAGGDCGEWNEQADHDGDAPASAGTFGGVINVSLPPELASILGKFITKGDR